MNMISKFAALALFSALSMFAQLNSLVQTSLSAAITATQTTFQVASATGIVAPTNTAAGSLIFIQDPGQAQGEVATVTRVSGTTLTVGRNVSGNAKAHLSGAMVLVATIPSWFYTVNPTGTCTTATISVTPWLNTSTGQQWLCSSKTTTWVAGWSNTGVPAVAAADVASAAGATVPSGPLFHVTGTNAITSWTLPLGFNGGVFTAIFDGAATWTAAGNISLASLEAMTAGCPVTFTYEKVAAKWYPSTLTCAPTP